MIVALKMLDAGCLTANVQVERQSRLRVRCFHRLGWWRVKHAQPDAFLLQRLCGIVVSSAADTCALPGPVATGCGLFFSLQKIPSHLGVGRVFHNVLAKPPLLPVALLSAQPCLKQLESCPVSEESICQQFSIWIR